MASAVLRFRNRETGVYPAEPIAVPKTLINAQFSEIVPKLLAEFWPAVRDDMESVGESEPAGLQALALTVNGKRAPKNGTLADVVEEDESIELCIVIKGADDIPGLWIPFTQVQGYVPPTGMMLASNAKKRKGIKKEADPNAPARRKIKRWDEVETDLLVKLVQELGKGKWKKVLLAGAGTFDEHRTTVDLKDKWRNLERSGLAPELPDELQGKTKQPKKEAIEAPPQVGALEPSAAALAAPPAAGNSEVSADIAAAASVPETQPVENGAIDGVPKVTDQPTPSKHPKEFKARGARARGGK